MLGSYSPLGPPEDAPFDGVSAQPSFIGVSEVDAPPKLRAMPAHLLRSTAVASSHARNANVFS